MCESTAYLVGKGREEILLENVDMLENGENEVRLVDIFGQEKRVKARVKSFSLVDHKILLEELD